MSLSSTESLQKLRRHVYEDAVHYVQIVPAILGIIGPSNPVQQRRFGADFLAEAFASPGLAVEQKQSIAITALETLRQYLETPDEDTAVIKSAVQASTSAYPLIFKHIIYNPNDSSTWTHMAAIKSNILRRMDSSPAGVKVCCIKFIQRVVQVQTPGQISDPRRPDQNEISMALVPPQHPLIAPPSLEPEASGLLDRLLSVFQENQCDAIFITATLNCVGVLLRTRPAISNRILTAIMNFNPFKLAENPLTPSLRVQVRSIERTVRAFLTNLMKRAPDQPWQGRIQGYLERIQHHRAQVFDDSRKRSAPSEPVDGLDNAKRQRLDAPLATSTTPMGQTRDTSGPISLAQLFTLTTDRNMLNDVSAIPRQSLIQIVEPLLRSIDRQRLDMAINTVRARWLALSESQQPQAPVPSGPAPPPTASTTDTMNQLNSAPSEALSHDGPPTELNLGSLIIPQPPPLASAQVTTFGKATLDRVLNKVAALESQSKPSERRSGFSRLAAGNHDRDSWVTVITRLATRPTTGLSTITAKEEDAQEANDFTLSSHIREGLLKYVLTDFRKRISVAITWLNEEWYNERLQGTTDSDSPEIYKFWVLKFLDGIFPYIDKGDKLLLRFMSEVPEVNEDMLDRIKKLAQDPERTRLAVQVLQYMVMFRPPAREACLDALEELYMTNPATAADAAKVLKTRRPAVIAASQQSASPAPSTKAENGMGSPMAEKPAAAAA